MSGINLGIYFDLRNPGGRFDPARLYGFTMECCEEAERLGAHSIWVTEHHLFDDGYLTQPLTMAAAIAARTSRVRVGTAVMLAPLHPAVSIAEQAAVVDLISAGRLDLGLGAGYRVPEFELHEADLSRRYGTTDGRVRELRRIWGEGRVTPAPVQNPVPIWMGYAGPQGARRAGLLGEGLLSTAPELWEPYRAGLVAGGHDPANGRMAGGFQGWVTDDPERDWPVVSTHAAYQLDSYRRHMVEGTDQPIPRPVDMDRLRRAQPGRALGSFSFDTPIEVATSLRGLRAAAPVETVFFWASIGGMGEEMTMRNIHLLCTELAPLLAEPISPIPPIPPIRPT